MSAGPLHNHRSWKPTPENYEPFIFAGNTLEGTNISHLRKRTNWTSSSKLLGRDVFVLGSVWKKPAQMEAANNLHKKKVLSLQRHPLERWKDWQHLLLRSSTGPKGQGDFSMTHRNHIWYIFIYIWQKYMSQGLSSLYWGWSSNL